jgi:hypothetical protein
MQMHLLRHRAATFAVAVALLVVGGWASAADPPSRVARLGYTSGAVSFSPAGENDWVQATVNRPLTTGDRLWSDARARAEIQVGGAMIRMSAGTGISVLNLDDRIAQLQLTQGILNVRVRRLGPGQVFEVDTPNLAFTLRQPGEYRIEVDPDGNATTIVVRQGRGEVYGEGASYVIDSRQPYRFTGTGLREYQYVDAPRLDEFDRWASDRDRSYDNSGSARYVSQDVIGYQDLDANGTWRVDPSYGAVWTPHRVAAGWAPYRDGHWAWVDPWGWTWVDDAPWGFAVSHYGRWANFGGSWGWVPGPARTPAYYAPALVVFVGGANFQISISSGNVGGIGWFPLAPREAYRPSYPVSRGYFENINRSNTVINNTVINNTYNNTNVSNVVYANRQVPGAVVAVPTTAFVQAKPVSQAAVGVSRAMIVGAQLAPVAPVVPTDRSVRGAAAQGDKPPARVFERPVVARAAPPARPVGFAAQQQQLAARPGQPIDDAARRELKPAVAAPAPVVRVVAPAGATPPTALPPRAAPAGKADDARGKADDRKTLPTPAAPNAPVAPPTNRAPSQAPPPVPAAPAPQQRGKSEQGEKEQQRAQPMAPPPASPQQAAQPPVAAPRATPALPPAQPTDSRGRSDQREQGAAPPKVVPPQATPVAPAAQPAEQRGKSEQRGSGETRGQTVAPPPQRAAESKAVPPQAAAPVPAPQAPPQRSIQPGMAAPVVPPVPAAPPQAQRAKPEPVLTAKPAEPPATVVAPKAATAQPGPAPQAQPRAQESKPPAGKPTDKKRDGEDQPREETQHQKKE